MREAVVGAVGVAGAITVGWLLFGEVHVAGVVGAVIGSFMGIYVLPRL